MTPVTVISCVYPVMASIHKAPGKPFCFRANEATAMALAGHATQAVSQNYTHMDDDVLRAAVDKLPDVTGRAK